eukprot:16919-Heterococcus_DN1.PRE.1
MRVIRSANSGSSLLWLAWKLLEKAAGIWWTHTNMQAQLCAYHTALAEHITSRGEKFEDTLCAKEQRFFALHQADGNHDCMYNRQLFRNQRGLSSAVLIQKHAPHNPLLRRTVLFKELLEKLPADFTVDSLPRAVMLMLGSSKEAAADSTSHSNAPLGCKAAEATAAAAVEPAATLVVTGAKRKLVCDAVCSSKR